MNTKASLWPICFLACAVLVPASRAGTQSEARIALHAKPALTGKATPCDAWAPTIPCSQYTTNFPTLTLADVYVTVARADSAAGISGISMGVDYTPGSMFVVWGTCTDGLTFPNVGPNGEWPAAGGGNTITWYTCNRNVIAPDGVHAIVGYFYLYAYTDDVIQITDNNNLVIDKELRVSDCTPTESILTPGAGGSVGFGAAEGYNPCACGACVTLEVGDSTASAGGSSISIPVTVTNCGPQNVDMVLECTVDGVPLLPIQFTEVPPDSIRMVQLDVGCGLSAECVVNASASNDPTCTATDTISVTAHCYMPSWLSLLDVRNDQGRWVRLGFHRSALDVPGSPDPVIQYEVYRRVDPLPAAASSPSGGGRPGARPGEGRETGRPVSLQDAAIAGWDFVTALPAHGESDYSAVVPTLADSTISAGMFWSVFFVRAATADPYTFYDSDPDSGYSLDNLAPEAPLNLVFTGPGNLSWSEVEEADFDYYSVYGSDTEVFDGSATLIVRTTATAEDVQSSPFAYYHVTATDFAGNEGMPSTTLSTVGVPGPGFIPKVAALHQGRPNPFRGATTITFDLPAEEHVRLEVFDVRGRSVAVLVDRVMPPGRYSVPWPGRTGSGSRLGSGIYFTVITMPDYTATRKLVLLQ